MSYFLFGSFNSTYDKELLEQVKSYANEKNIYGITDLTIVSPGYEPIRFNPQVKPVPNPFK